MGDVTVIEPAKGWHLPNLREVWRYRHVLMNFVNRNFRVTYRQTIGGPIYAVYNPLMTMIGYTLLLGGLFGAAQDSSVPYPLFTFSALIIWTLFTNTVQAASMSLQRNGQLIQKIYIPRLIFPLVETAMELVNFAIAFVILLLLMLVYAFLLPANTLMLLPYPVVPDMFTSNVYLPTANILMLPVYLLLAVGTGLGIALIFAGFQARFRDTNYVVQLITRFLFFLTPIVYASSRLPAPFDALYAYNPMAVVVEGFRWSLFGLGEAPSAFFTLFALGLMAVLLIVGGLVFRRLETSIADVV